MEDREEEQRDIQPKPKERQPIFYLVFFIITLVTTTLAGAEWITGKYIGAEQTHFGWPDFWVGLHFSIPFLTVLTCHEFGHYFTAKWHKAKTTLPLYLPFWLGFLPMPSIGTFGAFIRIQSALKSRKEYFDVGVAGPIAGFVVALILLFYGFTHLPPLDYLFEIHPEYKQYGADYAQHVYAQNKDVLSLKIGKNLVFLFFEEFVVSDSSLIPNSYEIMHYPYLFAGYLALFFTSLNLIPIGQLDGGHVMYGLFGFRNHTIISPVLFVLFVFYAGLGQPSPINTDYDPDSLGKFSENLVHFGIIYFSVSRILPGNLNTVALAVSIFGAQYVLAVFFPNIIGYSGWTIFGLVLGRFLGVFHPPSADESPLDTKRKLIGWLAVLIFIVSFSPNPFSID
jgi:membrane-associated protease RseP (regulator of RpoE activity)